MITLDFSKPRLKVNGKSVDKFSIAYMIDSIKPYACATISMSVLKYSELKDWLKRVLDEENCCSIYGKPYKIVAL